MSGSPGGSDMANDSPALLVGKEVSPSAEIFVRNELGQMQKRLGVVGDLVPKLQCFQVTVVNQANEERIIDAIRVLLEDRHLEAQKLRYEAIIDTFQSYVDTGLKEILGRSHTLCTEAAGSFYAGLEAALTSFHPYSYQNSRSSVVKEALNPVITAADSYLVVLAIAFHSLTMIAPSAGPGEKVVIGKVNAAIALLERHLQRALLPLGSPKKSPMAALLFRGNEQRFLHYYPYCQGYEGQAGIVRMVGEANERPDEDRWWNGHKVSSDIYYESYLTFADTLILLIDRFKALKAIRLDFDPSAGPLDDPRKILDHDGSDTPRIALTTSDD